MQRLVLVVTLCLLTSTAAHSSFVFVDGNKLREWAEADTRIVEHRSPTAAAAKADLNLSTKLMGYIEGVADGLDDRTVCLPEGAGVGQIIAIVKKWLSEHPEKWNLSGDQIIGSALGEAFPCGKK